MTTPVSKDAMALKLFLSDIDMHFVWNKLTAYGISSIQDLVFSSDTDLQLAGVDKSFHRRKLMIALKALSNDASKNEDKSNEIMCQATHT